ncbi:hypothetical protein PHYC_03046 [Phycisphaerales bacterium]|nr:hypothetical protein PHYC_03046 [Phycisphaerales bacterium]
MHADFETDWLPNCQSAAPDHLPWAVFTDSVRVFQHDEDAVVWLATTLPGPSRALALCARLVLSGGRINYHTYPGYDHRYKDYKFAIGVDRDRSAYVWPVRCPLLDRMDLASGRRNLAHRLAPRAAARLEKFWKAKLLTPLHASPPLGKKPVNAAKTGTITRSTGSAPASQPRRRRARMTCAVCQ